MYAITTIPNLITAPRRTGRRAAVRAFGTALALAAALAVPAFVAMADPTAQPPRGTVLFEADFEGDRPLAGWSGAGRIEPDGQGGNVLVLEQPAERGPGYATATIELPVEKFRGLVVQFSARVKAQDVSAKPQPWNGVKFMAPVTTPEGTQWPAAEFEAGSFDWRDAAFRAALPENATSVRLVLGLENVTGKAWFDQVRVIVWRPLPKPTARPADGPVWKGHDLPRLRGAMISPNIDKEGLRVLGQQWNANLVRWQLIRRGRIDDPLDLVAYEAWLRPELDKLEAALPACEQYGLRVVVDLHSPPGGRSTAGGYAGSNHGLFTSAKCQRKFVEVWRHIAQRFKDRKIIWGYDLANEPVESAAGEQLGDWQDLAEQAARAIRQIDPHRAIIVEPPHWGGPQGLRELRPLDIPGIVYSVHMYQPFELTCQGVFSSSPPVRYPGEIGGRHWDKAALEEALRPVVEFQRAYGVHIYIGEFSAIRWAPDDSAYRYLKDLIEIFEAHDWDWSYHAFREWDGWSVEHGPDRDDHTRAATATSREQLLRSWFGKNKK